MTPGEKERYSRQIFFSSIGETGQQKICDARVAIVGCGALGSFHAESLVRAGVGSLRLIDRDCVDLSNLQRQWLYTEADALAETPKAIAAGQRLCKLNRGVEISPCMTDLTSSNAEDLLSDLDLILDGTDNFETRYLLNDISVKFSIPWIYGGAVGSYGIVMPVLPRRGPCFACLYPEPPAGAQPTCDTAGVLNSITAAVAAFQTSFALRLLVGWSEFHSFVQTIDVWSGEVRRIELGGVDPQCPVCQAREFRYLEGRKRVPVSMCGRNAVQLHESTRPLNLKELALRLGKLGDVRVNEFALRMNVPGYQLTFFPDGRAIVKGITDVSKARSLYARLVGS